MLTKFSVLDHSTSARDREKRKLYFVNEIFMTKNSIKHVLFFYRENAVVTQGDRRMFPKRLRALQKLRESLNNSMDCFTYKDYFTYVCLTNRFHVAVRLLSNRSQMTSKCGKNKKGAHKAIADCVTDALTTFWRLLWSITEQTNGNSQHGRHLIRVLNERRVTDGGNLCPLWLVILKLVWHGIGDTLWLHWYSWRRAVEGYTFLAVVPWNGLEHSRRKVRLKVTRLF